MYKNFVSLAISAALLLPLFFVDAAYAVQITNRKPPVDFLTVVEMYGWTRVPWQIVGILFVSGFILLAGLGIRRMMVRRHLRYGHQT